MPISEKVRLSFNEFTAQFEGRKRHFYLDIKGLVTTGVGNLVDPIELALVLPWRTDDGELASQDKIRDNWQTVKAMPFGREYAADYYDLHDGVHLTDEDIDKLVLAHVDSFAAWLEEHYFHDWWMYPDEVQTAILSMAWALGPDFPKKFPKFTRAILGRDWATAAQECIIPELGMDPKGRNAANVKLLMAAPT